MARYLTTTSWLIIVIAALLAAFFVPDVLRASLTVAVSVVVYAAAALAVVVLAYGVWSGAERVLLMRAQRRQVEHDAQVKVIEAPAGNRVWAHEFGGGYRNLTMDSRLLISDDRQATTDEQRTFAFYHQSLHAPARVVGAPVVPALAAPEPVPDLRALINQMPVAIVVGTMDMGKTTVLNWILEEYRSRAACLVLDPHAFPGKWPDAKVVGTGRNFDAISMALDNLVLEMNKRYKEIGAGKVREGEHPPIVVIADEWISINQNCANAHKLMVALLTESRKAALRVYVGAHSRRVKNLGVDRSGDLLDGVAFILLRNDGARRWAEVETNDGEQARRQVVALPGEYRVIDNSADELEAITEPPPLEPGSDDARVIQMYLEGASLREITKEVYQGKFGDHYNDKVRDILRRHKVDEFAGEK